MLCAPSLSGESFGMVLTEAFAAGTPVIASAIAGYSDVVTDGVDGVLVPPADPQRLAEELQRAHHEPERLRAMGEAARRSAQRYAWPRVADRVTRGLRAGDRGARSRSRAGERLAHWAGLRPADGGPPRPRQRLPSLDPPLARSGSAQAPGRPPGRPRRRRRARRRPDRCSRRSKIGVDNVVESIVRSDFTWVLVACGADGALAVLPRRLLVLDRRARRCPTARSGAATSPRRR